MEKKKWFLRSTGINIIPFVDNVPILYPPESTENQFSSVFQEGRKWNIGLKWVTIMCTSLKSFAS